jgi:HAMP domain-containing protein/CheY-like chemotaxis protein/signal transduction histidine kinase
MAVEQRPRKNGSSAGKEKSTTDQAVAAIPHEEGTVPHPESREGIDARALLRALSMVRKGDLSVRLPVEQAGIAGKIADTFNDIVEMNQRMARELERVSNTVGKEGRLGQRVAIPGALGDWAVAVESVNSLIGDLVQPMAEVSRVIGAVAKGDLSPRMAVEFDGRPLKGEFLRTSKTVNTMVDQLGSFASEVTRVAREVGTEGMLGGQAKVKGVAGTWKDLTDSVNSMASNLTSQVRNIAQVTTAVAGGDLSKKVTVDVKGEILELKNTINTMVDQLRSFASEVTRVAREVGTEGKLGGQADVRGVGGTWKDLTESVNSMASNLTGQVRNIAAVTKAVARGDLSKKITVDAQGEIQELKETINTMVDQLNSFAAEVTRVAREVGTEGKLGGQAEVRGIAGTWKDLTDSVNSMASNLTGQVRNIAEVTTAVASGDLSKKITVEVEGEILELKNTFNKMVDQLRSFASEVTRVAREVGTEGKLGGQANVEGVGGTWRDLTDSVNSMASNLTNQVRNIADVTTAVATGDLSRKITVDARGEILELKNTINTMVDQLSSFAAEVTRVAREVGTEGKLGGQAQVKGVAGTWKDLTDSVNYMASNLTNQVRNIADVTTAVANGDLSKKITVDVQGEMLDLKETINRMVDQLRSFASEVTRVAREVGTEGQLGGQAAVEGVAGTWRDLTDGVNSMASNLTNQVRNIADVTTAVATGDLSRKITVDARGEILELKSTINTMVDQLSSFAAEVTRVAREVGTEGKLGGQAEVRGVAGVWKDLTDNVNFMASNLTSQVRNIAQVTTAVATGNLTKKITVEVRGEIQELKETINTMVDQLSSFAAEVTRVAREVGTEGKLGGQAQVKGVAGTWKDLTDNVNFMALNLTSQVRNIAQVTTAVANGDLSKKITVEVRGEIQELKGTINTMVDQLNSFAAEVTRVAREVGTEGKLGGQAHVRGVAGVWKDLTDNVNFMASNLTNQVRNIAQVTTAVANGDLSKTITVDAQGEILELKETINTMVDQLNSFAAEVTRVAREVGTEGKLGGQAHVKGVAGTWKDLTDNVNFMASNLPNQVRAIAKVVTAVANGVLKQKLMFDSKGEIAELVDTINGMIDTLAIFADQVTTVAREVGVEGKLGGQAKVPGAAGTWKGLTDNVNQLANNLTNQVRAIAEVATAVTKGDLTRSVAVEASGEVAALKDRFNDMILTLRETTDKNREQDWLKTNLAKFTSMMQGQKNLMAVSKLILNELAPVVDARHAVFYLAQNDLNEPKLRLAASYGYKERKNLSSEYRFGEGLVGEAAQERERILLTNVPEDYVKISSGLGEAKPMNIMLLPIVFEGEVKAVLELASFNRFNETYQSFLDQLAESIGVVLNTIAANMKTEELLAQSQAMAEELQAQQEELTETNRRLEDQARSLQASEELLTTQQEELQQNNEELEEKARLLTDRNIEVERKNKEVEEAKLALEEKARQLTITSKYKSEFLANMSHELRTPLNSLLILAKLLGDNPDQNLTDKQVEFARTIYSAGVDLLTLINDILDLSKIESGMMSVTPNEVPFPELKDFVDRTFRQVAEQKELDFSIDLSSNLPRAIYTDDTRLQQVLKNLLSNAFKFTEKGSVTLRIDTALNGWTSGHPVLDNASSVIAFSVMDTGIGIPEDKRKIIFEAFQQADAGTTRKFGGTGLGLSISREIARLLGGEVRVESRPGEGSTFSLYLPLTYISAAVETEPGHGGLEGRETRETLRYSGAEHATETASPIPMTDAQLLALPNEFSDDRGDLQPGDRILLIVEDDPAFAGILLEMGRTKGFKGLVIQRGDAAVAMARRYHPDAVTLDLKLPDTEGWTVLDRLKHDPQTRHIPVHIISAREQTSRGLRLGAFAHLQKPVTKETLDEALSRMKRFIERESRQLLVVEDDTTQRQAIVDLVGDDDVEITAVGSGEEALAAMRQTRFDCMVLDLGLPDMSGGELIQRMKSELEQDLPVIVYTGRELTKKEETELQQLADAIIIKDVRSPDRLLDETALFLHRVESKLPETKRQLLEQLHQTDSVLAGKKALIVDDDVRNIYALTSLLEHQKMNVHYAESGSDGISVLEDNPDIDVVLMDVMMPVMDGYEAMRRIREDERFSDLPIIALTAKAMKGDREKCIQAGASDYITKPVDSQQLISLLRVWLYE